MEKPEPSLTHDDRDNCVISDSPVTDNIVANRDCPKTLKPEPNRARARTDNSAPAARKSRIDKVEPKRDRPWMLIALDKRENDRTDSDEPKFR
jgi:hypothetical protein